MRYDKNKYLPKLHSIAHSLGLHFNHCVSPSVLDHLVEILMTLEPHGMF